MSATDVAATWTGYGLWAIAIVAAIAALAYVGLFFIQTALDLLSDFWLLRHKGHLGAILEVLNAGDRTQIEKVHAARRLANHALQGTGWTADEVEHGRACPACGTQLRRKRPTQPVPPLRDRSGGDA